MKKKWLLSRVGVALTALATGCGGGNPQLAPGSLIVSPTLPSQVPSNTAPPIQPNRFSDVDFVDAQTGWVGGGGLILATKDGGRTWEQQYVGPHNILTLSFLSPLVGWAVASDTLLGTTDGGANWTTLGEPEEPLVSVQFVNPSVGWGVMTEPGDLPQGPNFGGKLTKTTDGGHTWTIDETPQAVQSVCAIDIDTLWAAGGLSVLRSGDGGKTWSTAFTSPAHPDPPWSADIQCAGREVAWVQFLGYGVALGHAPYIIYRTSDGGGHWQAMMEEQYTLGSYLTAPEGPGSYPGPFSVVDEKTAYFVGWCPACGAGETRVRGTNDDGETWQPDVTIPGPPSLPPRAVDFVDGAHGWAVFTSTESGSVLATTDGGLTWISTVVMPR